MLAVVQLQGHQYIVREGEQIVVDNVNKNKWDKIEVDQVLLVFDEEGKNIELWTPYLKWKKVEFVVVDNIKGEKINVIKFKNKNRYHRKYGFRPKKTILQVEKIV